MFRIQRDSERVYKVVILQTLAAMDHCKEDNVIFAGDLNWLPADGLLPLTDGWYGPLACLLPQILKPGPPIKRPAHKKG